MPLSLKVFYRAAYCAYLVIAHSVYRFVISYLITMLTALIRFGGNEKTTKLGSLPPVGRTIV